MNFTDSFEFGHEVNWVGDVVFPRFTPEEELEEQER